MISSKKLLQLARKWKMAAAKGRKRISFNRTSSKKGPCASIRSSVAVAQKGHFTVYTIDGKRFEIPLSYLGNVVFGELFVMAAEEFGIPSAGGIVLPIDASSMEYVTSLLRRGLAADEEKTLLMSLTRTRCSSYVPTHNAQTCSQVLCL